MQEGVATAKMEAMVKELRKAKEDLLFPVVHAFFGDSPNPNLDAEIAVFTEQCYQKRSVLTGKARIPIGGSPRREAAVKGAALGGVGHARVRHKPEELKSTQ